MTFDLQLCSLVFFLFVTVSALGLEDLLSCESKSPAASGYQCDRNVQPLQCGTFAILRTNSFYSSLFNLSSYLGINRYVLGEANGFSSDTEFLTIDQPLLIPLDCKCVGGFFEAELTKTTIKGESFNSIAQSLEGLTTCKAIKEKNPNISPFGLSEKLLLSIPLRCACLSPEEISPKTKLLVSYPVKQGDTIAALAIGFNTTAERIIATNQRLEGGSFRPESLSPASTLLIPLGGKPRLSSFTNSQQPDLGYPAASVASTKKHKRKSKMRMIGVYIAVAVVAFMSMVAFAAVFLFIQHKRKRDADLCKEADLELQKLSLSVRTTSEKKVSFEGSQNELDSQIIDATPHKLLVETYTIEEIKKATEDFDSSNLIEDSVFHGRISGKDLAIKKMETCNISKIDFGLFNDAIHHHPNIIRHLGTCLSESPDSFLVFEYAVNGSLKDWLHGGRAMKNRFIASCYCFLTWNQRLRICLDVATALQFMHHIMDPAYVHRNIKSRNIFLDEDFKAKVGNFGMARCVEDDIAKGYLAPEYLERGNLTPSIDIFAFGVILLEVLSGQTPISSGNGKGEDETRLSDKIKVILESDNADELREWIDSALGENYSFDAAVTLANLARACVEDEPSLRPNAGEIVEKLSRLVEELLEGEEQLITSERSCKPLFKAATTSTM
ncbi:protein LYK2 [Nicotiana sylvestris]|uniref:Protein LYK2 n=1 Tax=Nicotiana sylvestris TaxID=4096 RepID=A0A1U7YP69_NICSY|nr:PREDICTED: protein LYK2 [Nicotiana sylvestris]